MPCDALANPDDLATSDSTSMILTGVLGEQVRVRAWVPLDDEHTMFRSISAPQTRRRRTSGARATPNGQVVAGTGEHLGEVTLYQVQGPTKSACTMVIASSSYRISARLEPDPPCGP